MAKDDIREFYLGVKEHGARANAAGRGARHGASRCETDDIQLLRTRAASREAGHGYRRTGDMVRRVFWDAHRRCSAPGRAAPEGRHLARAWSWRATSGALRVRGRRWAWLALGLQRGEGRRSSPRRSRVAVRRHGRHVPAAFPTASTPRMRPSRSSTSSTTAAHASSSSRTMSSSTRPRGARPLPHSSRSSCSTSRGCADFPDPQVMSFDALLELGPCDHDAAHPS